MNKMEVCFITVSQFEQLGALVHRAEHVGHHSIDLIIWGEDAAIHYNDVRSCNGAIMGDHYVNGRKIGTVSLAVDMVVEYERSYMNAYTGKRIINIHKVSLEQEREYYYHAEGAAYSGC